MRRFVVGDIHGCYDKLSQLLNEIQLSSDDILYGIGDYCDRGEKNLEVLNLLTSLPNFIGIIGNHDIWSYIYLKKSLEGKGLSRDVWITWNGNGGGSTSKELESLSDSDKTRLRDWYGNLKFQIELEDVILKHTASITTLDEVYNNINLESLLEKKYCREDYDCYVWDRGLDNLVFTEPRKKKIHVENKGFIDADAYYKELFTTKKWTIYGHTPHINHGPHYDKDFKLINIDCGAFATKEKYFLPKDGQLCILNIDTFEWLKSDGEKGVFEKC